MDGCGVVIVLFFVVAVFCGWEVVSGVVGGGWLGSCGTLRVTLWAREAVRKVLYVSLNKCGIITATVRSDNGEKPT